MSKLLNVVSCACYTMTGNGPNAAEIPVILKQAHDMYGARLKGIGQVW